MKDKFGREWNLVTLKDKKVNFNSNWKMFRDCVLGLVSIILLISLMGWLSRV